MDWPSCSRCTENGLPCEYDGPQKTNSGDFRNTRTLNNSDLPQLNIVNLSTPYKPDNFRISPDTATPDWIEGILEHNIASRSQVDSMAQDILISGNDSLQLPQAITIAQAGEDDVESVIADWSGRGAHVDFRNDEDVPLKEGKFLGHGSMGSVFETTIRGHTFAWKRRFCRKKISDAERSEIEILKRVSHHHIVRLAGSYTHRKFLGLLLYPVATCDLATFLEDSEAILTTGTWDTIREERLVTLGVLSKTPDGVDFNGDRLLLSRMGCIISAVEYLHNKSIRHKDLKPSNILLSAENLWLTDFGTATDFSEQTVSTTEDFERGTPKYFAPEMAAFKPRGRPADIFSLGCVLLEMHLIQQGQGLEVLRELRTSQDKSFQANLGRIQTWLARPEWNTLRDRHIKDQIQRMLEKEPEKRPKIDHVHTMFSLIDTFQKYSNGPPLFGECCRGLFISKEDHLKQMRIESGKHLRMQEKSKSIKKRVYIDRGCQTTEVTDAEKASAMRIPDIRVYEDVESARETEETKDSKGLEETEDAKETRATETSK
ncbi:hypothetical protein N0V90_008399 [Kalmusia sp. IMI 367209]|nr:hypothetical protein N0V90_008399 [Kalmusia sp. IMI 367209]